MRFGRDVYPVVEEIHGDFTIGRAKVLREGDDVALVTTGIMVSEGLRAAEDLRARGHLARVIHATGANRNAISARRQLLKQACSRRKIPTSAAIPTPAMR